MKPAPIRSVSIIVRTYSGRETLLRRAIASIDAQDSSVDIQCVVVVDGEKEIDFEFPSSRVNFVILTLGKRVGRSAAANAGLAAATGEAIGFLDDDDWFALHHISTLVTELNANPDADAAYSAAWEISSDNPVDAHESAPKAKFFRPIASTYTLLDLNPFPIQSVLFRASLLALRDARFNVELEALEDWLFWQSLLIGTQVVYTSSITSSFVVPLDQRAVRARLKKHEQAYPLFKELQATAKIPIGALGAGVSMWRRGSAAPPRSYTAFLGQRLLMLQGSRRGVRDAVEYSLLRLARSVRDIVSRRSPPKQTPAITPLVPRIERSSVEAFPPGQFKAKSVVFTSINWAYLDKAMVLAESVSRFLPDFVFVLLVTDARNNDLSNVVLGGKNRYIVYSTDLPDCTDQWLFMHDVVECCTAVKPIFMSHALEDGADQVIYLDPDTKLFATPSSVLAALSSKSVVISPHLYRPATTDIGVSTFEMSALAHGIFNLGFVAIRSTATGKNVAKYWRDRCIEYCYNDVARGLFTDQKWFDHVPVFFDDIHILRYGNFNTAIWNVSDLDLRRVEGGYEVDARPLEMFHFSGWDNGTSPTYLLSSGRDACRHLMEEYQAEVDHWRDVVGRIPWALGFFDDGTEVTIAHRKCYRRNEDLQEAFPHPFEAGPRSYLDWLTAKGFDIIEEEYGESRWVEKYY